MTWKATLECTSQCADGAEAGLPGLDCSLWFGMFAPVGTPADVVDKIARDVRTVAQCPDVKERFGRRARGGRRASP